MVKRILCALLPALCLCGCLSVTPRETTTWMIGDVKSVALAAKPKYGVVRLAQLIVRTPYDAYSLAVCREDGTMDFDPYNKYPALPSLLLRGPIQDAVGACGLFARVVGPTSCAMTDCTLEVDVLRMRLACAAQGGRKAEVEVATRLLDVNRKIVAIGRGIASADAADGNYSAAFSRSLSEALSEALSGL